LGRDFEHGGGLFNAQAGEKSKLDRLGLSGIELSQQLQSRIQFHEFRIARWRHDHGFVQRDLARGAAPFPGASGQSVVDEDAAHHLGRQGEKVGAVLPWNAVDIHQPNEGLVDQGAGLQSVSLAFPRHITSGDALKLRMHDGDQLVERRLVAGAPSTEQRRDVCRLLFHATEYTIGAPPLKLRDMDERRYAEGIGPEVGLAPGICLWARLKAGALMLVAIIPLRTN